MRFMLVLLLLATPALAQKRPPLLDLDGATLERRFSHDAARARLLILASPT
jgi:hypothetical protein